jgi:hypothetical protein
MTSAKHVARMLESSGGRDGFSSMLEVIAHLRAGLPLYYKAPLSYRAARIDNVARPFGKNRIYIRANLLDRDSDPFTADAGHLDRFRRTP